MSSENKPSVDSDLIKTEISKAFKSIFPATTISPTTTISPDNYDTMFQNLGDPIKSSFTNFAKVTENLLAKMENTVITTEFESQNIKITYKTTISINGDITNEFSQVDDKIWQRHNSLVDNNLQIRKEISLKIVEILSGIVGGLVKLI
jgi:hypothetical protein